jgi:hypothetical protein
MNNFYIQNQLLNRNIKRDVSLIQEDYFELTQYSVVFVDTMESDSFIISEIEGYSFPCNMRFQSEIKDFTISAKYFYEEMKIDFEVLFLGEVIASWKYDLQDKKSYR